MQLVERRADVAVGLGQARPRFFVAAPSKAAQHGGEQALCALFVRKIVAEFMIAQQHARIRRERERVIGRGADPFRHRVRITAAALGLCLRRLAAADDKSIKGHVIAEKHCIEPAVPCADGVAQTAVHLLGSGPLLSPSARTSPVVKQTSHNPFAPSFRQQNFREESHNFPLSVHNNTDLLAVSIYFTELSRI